MRILALDMAKKTGWAFHSLGKLCSGTWDLSIRADESSGMRLVRFEAKLQTILDLSPDVIAFEAVSVAQGQRANFNASKLLIKLQATLEHLVELTPGVECCSRNLQSIKSHALPKGSGARDKAAMLAAARKRWPDQDVEDDNQADALFLLDLVRKELNG